MGEVVVITSGKGGTGKTTLCAGIASCLAAMNQKVLAIDCDIGLGNLDIALGMTDCASISFLDIMMENQYLSDAPRHPDIPNLQLLIAPTKTRAYIIDNEIFGRMLEEARESFDWILLDAPAGIGQGFELATEFADRAIVVLNGDQASRRDGRSTAEILQERRLSRIELVVNRASKGLFGSMRSTIDDVMDDVGLPLLGVVPEDRIVPVAAQNRKALVLESRKGAAMACLHVSRRLMGLDTPLMKIR